MLTRLGGIVEPQSWNGLGNGIQTNGIRGGGGGRRHAGEPVRGNAQHRRHPERARLGERRRELRRGPSLMNGSNGWDFTSSEGAVAPRLTVDWTHAHSRDCGLRVRRHDGRH